MKQQRAPPLLAGAVTLQYDSTRSVLGSIQELSAAFGSTIYWKITITTKKYSTSNLSYKAIYTTGNREICSKINQNPSYIGHFNSFFLRENSI
jgi:hypothetical protein